jgi:hypothetical protein
MRNCFFPLLLGLCLSLVLPLATTYAQKASNKLDFVREPRQVARELENRYAANRQQALQLARKYGWSISETTTEGATIALQGIDERGMPVYHITYSNTRAAITTSTDKVWPDGAANLKLSGSHPALAGKLGIWDAGRIRTTHQELEGRVVLRDAAATNDNHATHVAGTLIATGKNAAAKGMAYGAANLQAWDFNFDIPEIAGAAGSLLVSNHSYGSTSGWRFNSNRSPRWEWWGDISVSTTEDNKFGQYNFQARDLDQIAYYNPYFLMVKAAGNNRTENGPAEGASFWRINATRTAWELVEARPAGMSSNNSFESIPTYGNSKNMLMVGAVEPLSNGYQQPSDVKIAAFSSWGPTDDGRIKPDLVGNGVGVNSSVASNDGAYATYNGTSMASPNVAGSLFLLQEHYANLHNGAIMRAATLKGLAIHTADEAGAAPGPDYVHGWGLLNTQKAAAVISNTGGRHALYERMLAQGETYTLKVTAAGSGPLVITISWTDPEGASSSATLLNDRAPKLVNDLDVRVAQGFSTFQPWVLDPANPGFPATFGDNTRDNVEQVFIANPLPGETYTINVRHKGKLQRGPQAYALLISGINSQTFCLSEAQSEADSRFAKVVLGNLTYTPSGCATYRDLTSLALQVEPGQEVPFSLTLGTCGGDFQKIARIFADWNNDGDFDDAGETVATSGGFTGTGDFWGSFTVPAGLAKAGDKLRIRLVLRETAHPDEVQACGQYAKGETQDYLLQVTAPSNDVGVTGLVFPVEGLCVNPSQTVTVSVRNFGAATQTDIAVSTEVRDETGLVALLKGTLTGPLAPLHETAFTLPETFAALAGKTYTFHSTTALIGDQEPSNNAHIATRAVSKVVAAPTARAIFCGNGVVTLQASGEGAIFWYDAPSGGKLLAAGHQATTDSRPADKTYYVSANDFSGRFGPADKDAFTGGGYNQFTSEVHFSTQMPIILEKARLYIGNPGRILLSLFTAAGEQVSAVSLDVAASRSPAAPNSQPNDPKDAGAVYDLNLAFPQAGDYVLKIAYQHGATIFRSNSGVTGYPYTIPGVIALTGNNTSDLYYYYLYDLQVKASGCPSTRVPVVAEEITAPVASITPQGSLTFCQGESVVLQASQGSGYTFQWLLNGEAIEGATSVTFRASEAGAYAVTVTDPQRPASCNSATSAQVVLTVPEPTVAGEIVATTNGVCNGNNSATLRLEGQTGTVLHWESSPDQSTWNRISSSATTLPLANLTQTTYYRATVRNGDCETRSTPVVAVRIDDLSAATITASGPTTFCAGASVTLTASEGDTYVWSNGETSRSITVSSAGSYAVTIVSALGCSFTSTPVSAKVHSLPVAQISANGPSVFCAGGSVTLTATEGSSYSWSTGETTRSITVQDTGEYVVTVTNENECQATSAPLYVTVFARPVASITADGPTTFCQGSMVTLTANEASAYLWSNGQTTRSILATASGNYTVTVRNEEGCSVTSAPFSVVVEPAIAENTLSEGQAICLGATPTALKGSLPTGGTGRYAYLWESSTSGPDTGFGPAPGFNKDRHYAPEGITQPTWFRRIVYSGSCENVSAPSFIGLKMPPSASIEESNATTFCQGSSILLTARGGSQYRWSTGETTQTISVTESGTYSVTVINDDDCSTTANGVTVTVHPLPNPPVISRTGNVLVSSQASGNQWYRHGVAIEGATGQEFEAFQTGHYTVVTTHNGCSSLPALPVAFKASIEESTLKLAVAPNPTEGNFRLSFEVHGLEEARIRLVNLMGQEVYHQQLPRLSGRQAMEVEPGYLPDGMYLMQLQVSEKVFTRKIAIKH